MARVIVGGTEEFDALVYGAHTPSSMEYLQSQAVTVRNRLLDCAREWTDNARAMYQMVDFDSVARRAKAVIRMVGNMWAPDTGVYALSTIDQLQHANNDMQRWIMAEPTTRKLYLEDKVEGYAESYRNIHNDAIGDTHYDYRRVMDAVVVETEDGDEWEATTYFEELIPDDTELSLSEQADILSTWAFLRGHIAKGGDDPTSRFNASMAV